MTLPEAEKHLWSVLTTQYVDADWQPALNAVMDAEGDSDVTIHAVEVLATGASNHSGLKIHIPAQPLLQLTTLEDEVTSFVNELKNQHHIFGEPLGLDDFLKPTEEAEIGDPLDFEGGDEEIVAQAHQEIVERNGDVIDVNLDDDEHVPEQDISCTETLKLCEQLKQACLQFTDMDSPDLLGHLQISYNEM
ncbi:hypothetical protein EDC04DRAFT_2897589 [Pisolithus marmoratus]|nr:hypothetical protein EDC04DRAFT_2897589 [Pisolithus marmoratus]